MTVYNAFTMPFHLTSLWNLCSYFSTTRSLHFTFYAILFDLLYMPNWLLLHKFLVVIIKGKSLSMLNWKLNMFIGGNSAQHHHHDFNSLLVAFHFLWMLYSFRYDFIWKKMIGSKYNWMYASRPMFHIYYLHKYTFSSIMQRKISFS